jgi:Tfp pilus assembly protein PilN
MNGLNLFPPWMRERKRRRKLIYKLAFLQVVVFLLLAAAVAIVGKVERSAVDRSIQLARVLAEMDSAPILAAEAVRETEALLNQKHIFMETRLSMPFDPGWLTTILESVPETVRLAGLDYTAGFITLTVAAEDIYVINTHRQRLQETDTFESVLLGRINRQQDGNVVYELRLEVTSP